MKPQIAYLSDCPYCGSSRVAEWDSPDGACWHVGCLDCNASLWDHDDVTAREKWNKRYDTRTFYGGWLAGLASAPCIGMVLLITVWWVLGMGGVGR